MHECEEEYRLEEGRRGKLLYRVDDGIAGLWRQDFYHDDKDRDGGDKRDNEAENQPLEFACADGFINQKRHGHQREEQGAQAEGDVTAGYERCQREVRDADDHTDDQEEVHGHVQWKQAERPA